jgi:hypothetical protein
MTDKSVWQGLIITIDEAPALVLAAADGDPNAAAIMRVIANWLKQAAAITDPNKTPLCLDCDTAFTGAAPPLAFAILMPFMPGATHFVMTNKKKGDALTTGICARCLHQYGSEKLLATAMREWRKIVPDAQTLQMGHG